MFIIILRILHDAESNLFHIAHATGAPRVFSGSGKNGKQNRGENCDNCNDDQKFNESKASYAICYRVFAVLCLK